MTAVDGSITAGKEAGMLASCDRRELKLRRGDAGSMRRQDKAGATVALVLILYVVKALP